MKWYLITPECSLGMENPISIEGMYEVRRILPVGTIIPAIWKYSHDIENLYLPANYLAETEPSEKDYALLYMLWPQTRPNRLAIPFVENPYIGNPETWVNVWYEIQGMNHKRLSSVPYGVSALMDIEGVCKAGQVAKTGDIVPAAFFAGLSTEQFEQFLRMGIVSQSWLSNYPAHYRAEYMQVFARPVMARAALSPYQKEALYEQFSAMAPTNLETPAPLHKSKLSSRRK
jgi:hypothetical protein